MDVATEREAKLQADVGFTMPDLRPVAGGTRVLEPLQLWSTYFDTPDLRLWERRITLRHRTGEDEGPGIWTLKLPLESERNVTVRSEHTWPGSVDDVPPGVRQLTTGIVRNERLTVIAELECTRRRVVVVDDHGDDIGEVDDDSVTVHGGPADGLRFHEVEFEAGRWDARAQAVLDQLVEAGARPTGGAPKLSRALGTPDHVPAEDDIGRSGRARAKRTRATMARATMEGVVRASLLESFGRIVDNDVLMRAEPMDPPAEAIHQARVGARRLRSDLKTLAPVLDPVWSRHVSSDLRWLGAALGQVRDVDVLTKHLLGARRRGAAEPDGLAVLVAALSGERKEAGRNMDGVLNSSRYLALLDKLHAASSWPPVIDPQLGSAAAVDGLPGLVALSFNELARRVRRARSAPTDHRLHKVRIAAKQLRYAADLATPVVGRPASRTAAAAKQLQTTLGEHQDAVMARAWLLRWAESGPSIAAFAAGQLTADGARTQAGSRAAWSSRWHRVRRKKLRRWLGPI